MANNGNGRLVMYLVGVIVTLVLFIGFPTLVSGVIQNDKESRARDTHIDDKVDRVVVEQLKINGETAVALTSVSTDVEWIKENVKKLVDRDDG